MVCSDYCFGIGIRVSMVPSVIQTWLFPDKDHEMNSAVPLWMGLLGLLLTLPVSLPFFALGYLIEKIGYLKPIRRYLCG